MRGSIDAMMINHPAFATARATLALALLISVACQPRPVPDTGAEPWDLVISGGTVIDGTGSARFPADVAVRGDRIAVVSRERIAASRARRVIDATGRIVAPGFIDLHAHLDPLPELPGMESAVRQGVTTAVGGPDGGSPWPLAS